MYYIITTRHVDKKALTDYYLFTDKFDVLQCATLLSITMDAVHRYTMLFETDSDSESLAAFIADMLDGKICGIQCAQQCSWNFRRELRANMHPTTFEPLERNGKITGFKKTTVYLAPAYTITIIAPEEQLDMARQSVLIKRRPLPKIHA